MAAKIYSALATATSARRAEHLAEEAAHKFFVKNQKEASEGFIILLIAIARSACVSYTYIVCERFLKYPL